VAPVDDIFGAHAAARQTERESCDRVSGFVWWTRFGSTGRSGSIKKVRQATTSLVAGNGPAPVRVRLNRVTCDYARPYPPEGQAFEWWQRLKNAFGTASSAFVDASLQQVIAAARLPGSGIFRDRRER
jgi:hypothetical protein